MSKRCECVAARARRRVPVSPHAAATHDGSSAPAVDLRKALNTVPSARSVLFPTSPGDVRPQPAPNVLALHRFDRKRARMSRPIGCPNSTAAGCKCPEHALGLAAYATDQVAYAAALDKLRPVRLHVVTLPPSAPTCNGTMTCPCNDCARERLTPRNRGVTAHQPWTPRPARRRAA